MINGIMPGTTIITGDAAIKYAVTGVITDKAIAHGRLTSETANKRHAFMIGPVIKTLKDLKI